MTSNTKPLSVEVEELVRENGGWLNVIPRLTNSFDKAITNLGKLVDCPFQNRHSRSGGVDSFRFSSEGKYEGRAICTCMPEGMGPIDLLLEDGAHGHEYVKLMLRIRNTLKGKTNFTPRRSAPVVVSREPEVMPEEKQRKRKEKLMQIAKDLLPLDHPDAKVARQYFASRGIPLSAVIGDVKFHPGLEYFNTRVVNNQKVKELHGRFPTIVSACRSGAGPLVNLHKIYLTPDGRKLDSVTKPKKVDSPLQGFKGSSIKIATVPGCRTLHVTEGVEKGWAIHLATGETVRAATACSMLATMAVSPELYDRVVIWSDNDPMKKGRFGAGQTFAWKLFLRLLREGFEVTFMLPSFDHVEGAKGPDWEDIIVSNNVLQMPPEERMSYLRTHAEEGGVTQGWKCKKAA